MTPYSAAADGSFDSRSSSRRACFSTSSGRSASSICERSSASSACCSSPSPSSSWIAFSCWRRKYSRCDVSISDWTWDWIFVPSSKTSSSRERMTVSRRRRSSTSAASRSSCFSSVLRRIVDAMRLARALGDSALAAANSSSSGRYGAIGDDAAEERLDRAPQGLHLALAHDDVGEGCEPADEVGLGLLDLVELDAILTLDEHAQRPVGDADHLVDDRGGADVVEVVGARSLLLGRAARDERDRPVGGHRLVDELIDRSWPIASGVIDPGKTTVSRSGRIGSSSPSARAASAGPLLDGAHASASLVTSTRTGCDRCRRGKTIVRSPCSYRASAVGVDSLGSDRDVPLEGPVVDLDVLVVAPAAGAAGPRAGDGRARRRRRRRRPRTGRRRRARRRRGSPAGRRSGRRPRADGSRGAAAPACAGRGRRRAPPSRP